MSRAPARLIAPGFARELVPQAELTGSHRIFFIVAGSLCGLPVFVLAAQVSAGLGLTTSLAAFVLGGIVSGVLGGFSAYVGAKTRSNLAMLAERAFGRWGGEIVKLVIALCLIGWFGVILSVLATSTNGALSSLTDSHIAPGWISTPAAVAVALITLRGVAGLERIGMIVAPLLVLLLLWTISKDCGATVSSVTSEPMTFGARVSAVIGIYIVGIVIQPDYGRFVRHPRRAALASGLALAVVYPLILAFSSIPAVRCGAPDLISVMVSVGIGVPALILLFLGAWIDASASLYSGCLSLANQFRLRLPWVIVGVAVLGAGLAAVHAEKYFLPFLLTLGITLPPVAAVLVLDVILASRTSAARSPVLPMRYLPCGAWLVGSVAGYASQSGLGEITGIPSIDSILVTASIVAAAGCWQVVRLRGTSTQSVAISQGQAASRRLKVLAEADPGALARILQPFQSLNIIPFSVRAARVGDAYLEVGVEITAADLSPEGFQAIVAKLGQLPTVMAAVVCT